MKLRTKCEDIFKAASSKEVKKRSLKPFDINDREIKLGDIVELWDDFNAPTHLYDRDLKVVGILKNAKIEVEPLDDPGDAYQVDTKWIAVVDRENPVSKPFGRLYRESMSSVEEEKAIINTMMAGLNEKDIFSPAEPDDLKKRSEEVKSKFAIGTKVRLNRDAEFYDYETGSVDIIPQGNIGKVIKVVESQITVEFPDGSQGLFVMDDLSLKEDIFKPAKEKDVNKRKKSFEKSKTKALGETMDIMREFVDMYYELTRNDEDPPEYLIDLNKEMMMLRKEVVPEDPESILELRDRARELLRQLKIWVTGDGR